MGKVHGVTRRVWVRLIEEWRAVECEFELRVKLGNGDGVSVRVEQMDRRGGKWNCLWFKWRRRDTHVLRWSAKLVSHGVHAREKAGDGRPCGGARLWAGRDVLEVLR